MVTHATLFSQRHADDSVPALPRDRLIAGILAANPSATLDFLADFEPDALAAYLDRLTRLRGPEARGSRWVRRAGEPAVACHTPDA